MMNEKKEAALRTLIEDDPTVKLMLDVLERAKTDPGASLVARQFSECMEGERRSMVARKAMLSLAHDAMAGLMAIDHMRGTTNGPLGRVENEVDAAQPPHCDPPPFIAT